MLPKLMLTIRKHLVGRHRVLFSSISEDTVQRITLRKAYETTISRLQAAEIPEAEQSARYLLSEVMQTGYRVSDFNKALKIHDEVIETTEEPPEFTTLVNKGVYLSRAQQERLDSHCQQREKRVPIQYIIGNWEFYGLELICEAPVLIPRPETEELVEHVIATLKKVSSSKIRILDVGAGTGAIGLALLHHLPNATCVALDINSSAVSLATQNATNLGLNSKNRYECIHMSLEEYALSGQGDSIYDIIVSNPPYIPTEEMDDLQSEVALYESFHALHGGSDGLDVARQLLQYAPTLLSSTGTKELWMELAPQHPPLLEKMLISHSDSNQTIWNRVEALQDLSGRWRFVRVKL